MVVVKAVRGGRGGGGDADVVLTFVLGTAFYFSTK